MRILLIALVLIAALGCDSEGSRILTKVRQESAEKAKLFEGEKIKTVRVNDNSIDFVTEEGYLITVYGYRVMNNGRVDRDVGIGVK